jgi:protease-4
MSTTAVDNIGQGRVWIGTDAKKIGLIDEFGGLTAAIDEAAKMANIEKYVITELPEQKDPIEELVKNLLGQSSIEAKIKAELGPNYKLYQYMKYWQNASGVQARMPFDINLN